MMNSSALQQPIAVHIDEAVRLSGIGRTSLYTLITDGRIRTVRLGRRRLVLVESLREFLEGQSEA